MRAMTLRASGTPLVAEERALPEPGAGQVRLRVHACAVCRTDLHLVDGELPMARLRRLPLLPRGAREPVRRAAVHGLHA